MKNLYLLFLWIIISVLIVKPVFSQNIDKGNYILCEKNGLKILMPKIDSMVECYYQPLIFKTYEALGNKKQSAELLAVYLNKSDLDEMLNLNKILNQDESFSLRGMHDIIESKYTEDLFKRFVDKTKFDAEAFWGNSKLKEIEKSAQKLLNGDLNNSNKITISIPILVNSYKLANNAFAICLLTQTNVTTLDNSLSDYVYQIVNIINIKKHFFYLYYTISYTNNFRLNNAKAKNDYIVYKILNLNSSR